MNESSYKVLLVDHDSVFRLGLRLALEPFADLQVVAEADSGAAALQILADRLTGSVLAARSAQPTTPDIDLVTLDLSLGQVQPNQISGLELCRRLKAQYPTLAILLLSAPPEPAVLAAALQAGANGYCPKGTPVAELVAAMHQVAAGQSYPLQAPSNLSIAPPIAAPLEPSPSPSAPGALAVLRENTRLSGLQQIDAAIADVTAQLQLTQLDLLERAILAGRRRELLAARWLVNRLLGSAPSQQVLPNTSSQLRPTVQPAPQNQNFPAPLSQPSRAGQGLQDSGWENPRALQSALFDATVVKLQSNLQNLTDRPLELDILREDKKRDLLYNILRKLEDVLDELRFSQVQPNQLPEKQATILQDLWQAAITDFFGKYYTLQLGKSQQVEVVRVLLQDAVLVQTAILQKTPLTLELFAHLLFQTPLMIDNALQPAGSPEAMERAEALLQNLIIQVANGVIQPLLNHFADVEVVKQSFYDRRLLSTREIERFRNNLSWKYRLDQYVGEPKAIFESQFWLMVLSDRGIQQISIYSPRGQELQQLSGIPLTVTLALEIRDAIAPRVRSAVSLIGSSLVYVLTEVIGRGIGLIGRGILQGIGSTWQDSKFSKNSERQK